MAKRRDFAKRNSNRRDMELLLNTGPLADGHISPKVVKTLGEGGKASSGAY